MSLAPADDRPSNHGVDTLIGQGTLITGSISFAGGMRIEGEVRGIVRCADGQAGKLVVGPKGSVAGEVEVTQLVAAGTLSGRVRVAESIRVEAGARVECDLEYAALEVHWGAVVQGALSPRQRHAADEAARQFPEKLADSAERSASESAFAAPLPAEV